mmetsp:Transcript_22332/g.61737  ORF Transcript_22332/g.61737 Transcript_22332/m.61737 type:complete len:221 (+) Transcript_22332:993-1655(+)
MMCLALNGWCSSVTTTSCRPSCKTWPSKSTRTWTSRCLRASSGWAHHMWSSTHRAVPAPALPSSTTGVTALWETCRLWTWTRASRQPTLAWHLTTNSSTCPTSWARVRLSPRPTFTRIWVRPRWWCPSSASCVSWATLPKRSPSCPPTTDRSTSSGTWWSAAAHSTHCLAGLPRCLPWTSTRASRTTMCCCPWFVPVWLVTSGMFDAWWWPCPVPGWGCT